MTDRSKFEQMLELLINEETDKAKELFHDIVVEKSREIYESLLAEDFNETGMPGAEDELAAPGEGEMGTEEAMGDEFSSDDETDDMMGDIEGDDDMDGGDVTLSGDEVTDLQDRVVDLEDALDSLRDEFESLMGGEEDGEMGPEEPGMGDDEDEMAERYGDDEELMPGDELDDEFGSMSSGEYDEAFIREYVEKVTAKMGDNGAFTKSTVAKKNDMGGTTANIAKGGDGGKGGTQGGLLNPSTKDLASGNVNVPGGKAGVKHLKNVPAGHGAEKKGSKPDSEKSLLGK
jgi:hypothetical protein